MTQPQLERLCRTWQRRLRLSDWRVDVTLVPLADMPDLYGETWPDETELTATMRVRDCPLVESTLIHELLHLRLLPYSDGDPEEPRHGEREQAINLLADCYLRAYPRRRKAE
jgi:hypothetical protein